MTSVLIPIALLLLPYCAVRATQGHRHSLTMALLWVAAAIGLAGLILFFDNGLDAPDGAVGARILAPYFVLSLPLAIAAVAVAGWLRHRRR